MLTAKLPNHKDLPVFGGATKIYNSPAEKPPPVHKSTKSYPVRIKFLRIDLCVDTSKTFDVFELICLVSTPFFKILKNLSITLGTSLYGISVNEDIY